ncbi:hypothetical protein [Flagellimonas sp.]|uniref:hypothetical protein n=1 Tax=Flagellimonas sp. TaxID=2058762 RepID=UPI003F4A1587
MSNWSGIPSLSVSGQETGEILSVIELKFAGFVVKNSMLLAKVLDSQTKSSKLFFPEEVT